MKRKKGLTICLLADADVVFHLRNHRNANVWKYQIERGYRNQSQE